MSGKKILSLFAFLLVVLLLFPFCDSSTGAGDEADEPTQEQPDTRTPDTTQPNTGKGGGSPGTPAAVKYAITMDDDGNGTATATPASAAAGATVTVSSMPNAGFAFKEWQIISGGVTLSPNLTNDPATFTMPANAVTIKAIFDAVTPGTPSITLSPSPVAFSDISYGDPQLAAATVTINNTGLGAATVTGIALSGTNAGSFTLGGSPPPNITFTAGGTASFTVRPNASLAANLYDATITVTYDGGATAATNVSLTVNKASGSAVSKPAVSGTPTSSSITISAVTLSTATGQDREYAIDTTDTADPALLTWTVNKVTFDLLSASASYYVYARSVSNTNYNAGTAQVSAMITTDAAPTISIEMVWIPAGSFMMGSPTTEPYHQSNETQHSVTLTTGFNMGKYSVTQDEFFAVMETNPSFFQGASYPPESGEIQGRRPVEQVSWYDAIAFCNKLSAIEHRTPAYLISGISDWENLTYGSIPTVSDSDWDGAIIDPTSLDGYRLPTEAQWEYACRATTTTAFNDGTNDYSVIDTNIYTTLGWFYHFNIIITRTHEVGLKNYNTWGLYDMHGNVWEWCWDWYDTYPTGPVPDPMGASSGSGRVCRGGSFFDSAAHARSARRYPDAPSDRNRVLGFRVVCPP